MKHFLITRFNLKGKKNLKGNRLFDPLSKEWLDKRVQLFSNYCLPSVKNQTNKEFIWLVCFDIDTPKAYLPVIENIKKDFKNFTPIYVDGFGGLKDKIQESIQTKITSTDDFIITTRIDNDDIIHQDFIKSIQEAYKPETNTLIDLRKGYQFIIDEKTTSLRLFTLAYNPFLSLIESADNYKTIIAEEHRYWKTLPNIIINSNKHLWIQVVHDQNLLNRKRNYLKKVCDIDHTEFGLKETFKLESRNDINKFNRRTYFNRMYYSLKKMLK